MNLLPTYNSKEFSTSARFVYRKQRYSISKDLPLNPYDSQWKIIDINIWTTANGYKRIPYGYTFIQC